LVLQNTLHSKRAKHSETKSPKKKKKNFLFLAWARPISPRQKYPSPERKIYRLGKSSPKSKVYFRLSENTLAWARIPPRFGERFLA